MIAKRFNRRRLLSASAAAALLAACGAPPTVTVAPTAVPAPAASALTAAAPTPAGAVRRPVTFWFDQPPQQKAFEATVARFHKEQEKIELKFVVVPTTDVPLKLTTAIAAGDVPDATRLSGPTSTSIFIKNGADGHAAALDGWDPKIGTYDWINPIQQSVTRGGKMYTMPVNSGALCLFYNKNLYRASGLDPEKPPATMDELMELASKIARPAEQTWGHYTATAPTIQTGAGYFAPMLFVFGGKDVSEDGKVLFNSPEGVAAMQWYADLAQKHKAMPVKKLDQTSILNEYLTGKVGSIVSTPAVLANVEAGSFKSGSAQHPKAKTQTVTVTFGTIMILDKAKNRDGGWEFARYVGLDAKNNNLWCQGFGNMPTRPSYREEPGWKTYEQEHPLVPPFGEAQKTAELSYYGPGSGEMYAELGAAVEAVTFGQKTPKQALDDAAAAGQQILDRERKKGA